MVSEKHQYWIQKLNVKLNLKVLENSEDSINVVVNKRPNVHSKVDPR